MNPPIFLTIFFGIFLAVGLLILGLGTRALLLSKQAEHWPAAPATIISSDFETNSDDDSTTYRAVVRYTYNVMGRELEGDKIAFGYTGSSGYSFHNEIYRALPEHTQVAVRYDPNKPERAVLSYGVNQSILFLLIFGGVWTVFTLGMMAMFWLTEQGGGSLLGNMIIYSQG